MTKLTIDLHEVLAKAFRGRTTHVPATVDLDEFLEFSDMEEALIDLDDLLVERHAIAFVWDIQHVKDQRPDLTCDQAWQVLQECQRSWDRLSDPMLETLRQAAENLYPGGKEALRRRVLRLLSDLELLPERETDNPAAYGELAAKLDSLENDAKGV